MKVLDVVVNVLLLIGALNWGLVGFFDFNLVATVFGEASAMSRVVYSLVGLSALYDIFSFTFGFKAIQHRWCEVPAAMKH
jgi:uncharacterized protein